MTLYSHVERFLSKVEKTNGCWLWRGACLKRKNGEYGQFSVGARTSRKMWKAHRFAWSTVNGPIPDGLLVLHRCDNPKCVRPDHLFLGSHADNMRDMVAKSRNHNICGKKNPWYGKPGPNASGDSMRGKHHSAETKAKISRSLNMTKRGVTL